MIFIGSGAAYESIVEAKTQEKIQTTIHDIEKKMRKQLEEAVELAIQKTKADEQEKYQIQLQNYQKQADEIIQVQKT